MPFQPSHLSHRVRPNPSVADTKMTCLSRGAAGPHVDILHSALKSRDYTVGGESTYGDKTIAAVRKFQSASGIYSDGVTGPQTWAQLGYQGLPCSGGMSAGGSVTIESRDTSIFPGGSGSGSGAGTPGATEGTPWYRNNWFWAAAGGGFLFISGLVIYHYKDEIEAWAAGQPMGSKATPRQLKTARPVTKVRTRTARPMSRRPTLPGADIIDADILELPEESTALVRV